MYSSIKENVRSLTDVFSMCRHSSENADIL